jgi:hypothetical protein
MFYKIFHDHSLHGWHHAILLRGREERKGGHGKGHMDCVSKKNASKAVVFFPGAIEII